MRKVRKDWDKQRYRNRDSIQLEKYRLKMQIHVLFTDVEKSSSGDLQSKS